jgi:hypothetical protein
MTPTDFSFFLPFFLLAVVFSLLQFVGMIFAIIDLLRREDHQVMGNSRVIWVLIVLFIPLAWIAYFVAGRR